MLENRKNILKILKINKKHFQDEELPIELFLTTIQTTKTRNVFANNLSTDIELSKSQINWDFLGIRFAVGEWQNYPCLKPVIQLC